MFHLHYHVHYTTLRAVTSSVCGKFPVLCEMCLGTQGVGILFLKQLVRAAETAHPGTCSPEWDPQNPHKSLGMVTCKTGGKDRWIPGACWPASLPFWQISNPMSHSNKKWRLLPKECPKLCSALHGHVHMHTSTYVNIHALINAY